MRPLELLSMLKRRPLDQRLAAEALRHPAFISLHDADGNRVRDAADLARVVRHVVTRRGKALTEEDS